jgi:hypothetical protein
LITEPLSEHADARQGFRYVAAYRAPNGVTRTVDIWAHDWNEAQQHIFALKNTLVLDGQVFMREDIEGGMQ